MNIPATAAESPSQPASITDIWLTRVQAANYLKISAISLAKLAVAGGGPPFYRPTRRVVYLRSDLDAWMLARRRHSTSDAGAN